MRRVGSLVRGAGTTCLLAVIVLCQGVFAHDDERDHNERRFRSERFIHQYQLVRMQKVSPELNEFVYRAWLTNLGAPIAGATAAVTSQSRATTIVDGSLTFGPAKKGETVMSTDTFTVRHHRNQEFSPLWPELRWVITPTAGGGTNHAPIANAGPNETVPASTLVTLDGSGSTDPDQDPLHYSWTLNRPVGSTATLSSQSVVKPSFMPDKKGSYEARLVVDDGVLPSSPASVVVTVANAAPVANAGPDQTALVTHVVTLDGSASSDPDGDTLSYQWSWSSRPAGSAATLTNATSAHPTFVVDRPGSYTASLVVNDGVASSAADTVTITTVNTAPVANAGPDQTAAVGTTVSLNGSGSSDADGDALSYAWALQSRPAGSAATLAGATSVTPTLAIDRPGTYVAALVVNDGQASSAADTVTISTVNSAPVANAGADQTAFVAQTVTLNGSGSSDVDGDPLTFAWSWVSRPAGSAAVLSDPTAVQPTFVVDRPGLYQVALVVNDGAITSAADVVDVQTVNSAPVANAGPDQTALVTQTVTLDGSGSTDVDGNPLTYVWAFTSRPAGSVAVLSDPTAVKPTFTLDRAGVYVAQLIVNDGTVSSAADTVTVTTLNSPPVANAGADASAIAGHVVPLNGSASSDVDGDPLTFSWALTQRPAGSAAVLTGVATAFPSFTADQPGVYVAQLIVNDGTVDSAPDTVTITTGNTAPVADAGPDQSGLFTGGIAALDGTGSSDADGHSLTYRWSLLSVPAGSAATLSEPTSPTPWFALDKVGQYVAQLIVNDGYQDSTPDTVVVAVVNRAPTADAGTDQSLFVGSVASLSGAASSDPDGDALTYVWAFTSMPAGSAASLSGAATVAPSFTPDVVGSYVVGLTVTDVNGATATASVTVSAFTPSTVTVSATDPSAAEAGSDPGVFTFTRNGSTAAPLVVHYGVGGTATNGTDYASLSGNVTIPAGQASATVVVSPVDDTEVEGSETVTVSITPDGSYTTGAPSSATVTITDNDLPVVSVAATDPTAAEVGGDTGTFTITRTGPTTTSLRVTYTVNGTATAGSDYPSLGTQIFIPAGSSTVTLTVAPVADGLTEGDETVNLFLTANSGLKVDAVNYHATVTILANSN